MQSPLQRPLRWLGAIGLVAYIAQTLVSYVAAPLATFESRDPAWARFYGGLAETLAAPGSWLHAALRGESGLADRTLFVSVYVAPTALATAVALAMLSLLHRHRQELTEHTARSVLRWSYVFAAVTAPALPVLVPDFWLSLAWGRVIAHGGNPYYVVPAGMTAGLPLSDGIMHMTYGPLWAMLSGAVMWLARDSALWGAVLFKLLIVAAWVAVLRSVARLMASRHPWEQCAALVATGWLPVGVVQVVGDGHNDVLMIALALAWLVQLEAGRPVRASMLLAASVATKYVTAPLFLLDVLWTRYRHAAVLPAGAVVRAYAPRAAAAGLIAIVLFAPFFRSSAFFAQAKEVQATWFFLPGNAVLAIGEMTGMPLRLVAYAVMLVFPAATLWLLALYLLDPSVDRFRKTVAGVMLSLLFVAAKHVWPWYVLWLLPFGVLHPESRLGRWTVGVALAAPLLLLPWTAWPNSSDFQRIHLPSLVVYGFALVWMLIAPRNPGRRPIGVT